MKEKIDRDDREVKKGGQWITGVVCVADTLNSHETSSDYHPPQASPFSDPILSILFISHSSPSLLAHHHTELLHHELLLIIRPARVDNLSRYRHRPLPPFHRSVIAWSRLLVGTLTSAQGQGEAFNPGRFLEESSPYAWALLGTGLCIGLSVFGAGWCVILTPECQAIVG